MVKVRTSATAARGGGGIVPAKHFCVACIVLLSTMLVVQICVLVCLLQRLAEVHRAAAALQPELALAPIPPARAAGASVLGQSGAAAASVGLPVQQAHAAAPNLRHGNEAALGGAVAMPSAPVAPVVAAPQPALRTPARRARGLSLGVACGLGQDAVLMHLASLTQQSDCHVVLFVESPALGTILAQEQIPADRVTLEVISLPLAQPWEHCHLDSARYRIYQNYFERTGSASQYEYVQLTHVEDVVFQGDPFEWVARQPNGVHVFGDQPGHIFSRDAGLKQVLQQAFGQDVATTMQQEVVLPVGYVVGTAGDVQRYVDAVAKEVQQRPVCQKKASDQVVHDVLARRWLKQPASGHTIHMHDWASTPVWTGGHVPKSVVTLDSDKRVVNGQNQPYMVLHEYDEHDDLWKALASKFLKNRMQQRLEAKEKEHCSAFEVLSGDMRGFDLSHTPADTQEDCCAACTREIACGAFTFSASRKHCWLKRKGGMRIPAHQGEDLVMGARRS